MTQKRFITEDIWDDPTFSKLTLIERLLWVGLITIADDHGYIHASPSSLCGAIFPNDERVTNAKVREWRDGLAEKNKNFHLFTVDTIEYGHFVKWRDYQSPWKPKPSRIPPCPTCGTGQELAKNWPRTGQELAKTGPRSGAKLSSSSSNSLGIDVEVVVGDPERVARWQPTLRELAKVVGYTVQTDKDVALLDSLADEFPTLDVAKQVKAWATSKLDRPLLAESKPRSQLRNWCVKALEFAAAKPTQPNVEDKVISVREQLAARGISR